MALIISYSQDIEVRADLADTKGFIIAHINCRSLLPKVDFLRHLMVDKPVWVLCLSETWLKPSIPDSMVDIFGYNFIRHDRATLVAGRNKIGGGIDMYVSSSTNYKLHDDTYFSTPDIEVVALSLLFEQCRNIFIITCYRPPNGNVENFIESLTSILNDHYDPNHRLDLIITGHIKIDLLTTSNHRKLLDEFMKRLI